MQERPDFLVARAAHFLVLGLLVVVPSAFLSTGVLAFEPLKTSLLRCGAVAIALCWIAARLSGQPRRDIWRLSVVRAALAVLAVSTLSTVLSIEPALSFFGGFERGMGLLTLASGVLITLCGADLWANETRREQVVNALLLGALVPCAYAVVQRLDFDPLSWTALGTPGSTLASPTFLSGYLVLVAPFAVYRVATSAGQADWRYAGWLALTLTIAAVVVQTTIRGALLGLFVGLLVFGVLAARRARAHLGGALLAAVLLVGVGVVVSGQAGLQRFLSIGRAADSSIERLTVWRDAVSLAATDTSRLVVGYGPETQASVLERARATVELTQTQVWDRAHNVALDALLTGGVIGLLALGALFAAALWSAWQAYERDGSLLGAAVVAALVGHVVDASFAFETVTSTLVLAVIFGLSASLSQTHAPVERGVARPRVTQLAAVVGLVLLPLLAAPAVADQLYGAAGRAETTRQGALLIEQAAAWAPWVEELPRAAGLRWRQLDADRAEANLLEAVRRAPFDPNARLRLARWYADRGEAVQAQAACAMAEWLGPYRTRIRDTCAEIAKVTSPQGPPN